MACGAEVLLSTFLHVRADIIITTDPGSARHSNPVIMLLGANRELILLSVNPEIIQKPAAAADLTIETCVLK